jgi:hypothetical protein
VNQTAHADLARRILGAPPEGTDRKPLDLLEGIFGREGDAAILAALAFWGLSARCGEAKPRDVDAVAAELGKCLESAT